MECFGIYTAYYGTLSQNTSEKIHGAGDWARSRESWDVVPKKQAEKVDMVTEEDKAHQIDYRVKLSE